MYFTSELTSLSSAKSHLPTLDHWSKFNAVSHIGQAGAGHLGAVPGDGVVGRTIEEHEKLEEHDKHEEHEEHEDDWQDSQLTRNMRLHLFSSSCSVIRLSTRVRMASPTLLSNSSLTSKNRKDQDYDLSNFHLQKGKAKIIIKILAIFTNKKVKPGLCLRSDLRHFHLEKGKGKN